MAYQQPQQQPPQQPRTPRKGANEPKTTIVCGQEWPIRVLVEGSPPAVYNIKEVCPEKAAAVYRNNTRQPEWITMTHDIACAAACSNVE